MLNDNKPLKVEIKNGLLSITIGIDTLKFAAEHSPNEKLSWFDEETNSFVGYKIANTAEFAKDVRNSLLNEEEDGTTPIHILLDNACADAIEKGSLAVEEKPVKINY